MGENNDRSTQTSNLSNDLINAVAAGRVGCFIDLSRLSDADAAALMRILKGKEQTPIPVDQKRALAALARSYPSKEAVQLLYSVVASREASRNLRVAAAHYLRELPATIAEPALLASLDVDDEAVLREVVSTLGIVGSAAALKDLELLNAEMTSELGRRLEFAKLLIGLREAPYSVDPPSSLGVAWDPQEVHAVSAQRIEVWSRSLHDVPYQVNLNADLGFEIRGGCGTHVVLLNAALTHGAYVGQIRARPMIAALVAFAEEHVEHLTIRYIALTSPLVNGDISVIVTRSTGEPAFSGDARADGSDLRLQLREVGLERTPVAIEGIISDVEIRLDIQLWRGTARPKRRPLAIPRPLV